MPSPATASPTRESRPARGPARDESEAPADDRLGILRQPPASVDAEKSVLGAVLLNHEVLDDVAPLLRPTMFYDRGHEAIYSVFLRLYAACKPVDMTLVVEMLKDDDMYEEVGGLAYLAALVDAVPHAASAVHYAEIVREMAIKRGVIQAATEILTRAWDRQQNAGELLSFSEGRLSDVHAEQAELSVRPIAFVIADVRRKENSKRPEDQAPAIVTGFRDLDERVRMRPGWLIILAARPSHGKSTLAMNIAAEVCKQQAGDTLFISCEMGDDEILAKMVSAESNVLLNDIVDGTMNAKDREYFMAASNRVSEWDLYLDVPRRRKASDIIALARRHQRRTGKLALIVVDYLGLLEPEASDTRGFTTRTDELAKMTRILKQGAQELKVPIMCLCQLSRTNEKTGERPKLHHLRDSGAIEQDADAVWFVHRPHFNDEAERVKENTRSRDTFAEIIVAKQRIGGTGMVRLDWHGQVSRFADQRERGPGEAPLFENQEEDF